MTTFKNYSTMEYSKVRRYLDLCQAYCSVFGKQFQVIFFFEGLYFLTIFDVWQDSKYVHVSTNATQLVQLFQVLFQAYSDKLEHYSKAYSRILKTLYITGKFKLWHICIKNHIQTTTDIHNTILKILTKAQSWMFDTVLITPLFYI